MERPSSASTAGRTCSKGHGRHLVAALLALGHQLGREHPLAGGDDLGQLDVGRTEPLGGQADPAGQSGPRLLAPALPQVPEPDGQPQHPDHGEGSAQGWDAGRTGQPRELLGLVAAEHVDRAPPAGRAVGQAPRRIVGERAEVEVVGGRHRSIAVLVGRGHGEPRRPDVVEREPKITLSVCRTVGPDGGSGPRSVGTPPTTAPSGSGLRARAGRWRGGAVRSGRSAPAPPASPPPALPAARPGPRRTGPYRPPAHRRSPRPSGRAPG